MCEQRLNLGSQDLDKWHTFMTHIACTSPIKMYLLMKEVEGVQDEVVHLFHVFHLATSMSLVCASPFFYLCFIYV